MSSTASETELQTGVEGLARRAKTASRRLATLPRVRRDEALRAAAEAIESRAAEVVAANERDCLEAARAVGEGRMTASTFKRLQTSERGVAEMAERVRDVAALEDPLGRTLAVTELDDGLTLTKISCPLGVVGVVFEARPEVVPQVASLALKSGNACLLKGGAEAAQTNEALYTIWHDALAEFADVPADAALLLRTREEVSAMLALDEEIDLIIPRGSKEFVKHVAAHSRIPVLGHGEGVCHVYVDAAADLRKALAVVIDSKTQYPAACNAAETLLVHKEVAPKFLPSLIAALVAAGVEVRACPRTAVLVPSSHGLVPATEEDWATEYSDMVVSVKTVGGFDEALRHIERYGSRHTEAIVTEDGGAASRFLAEVDAAGVYHNASTRFADGFRYGLGAELGISTGKLHARGPVGLEGLTTYKYLLNGDGHTVASYSSGERSFKHRRKSMNREPSTVTGKDSFFLVTVDGSRFTLPAMSNHVEIYDTTLRDGAQGEGVNFSVGDKCRIAEHLDALGVDFVEGGWPGSNPRDVEFFERARTLRLSHARLAAFGATRRRGTSCETDPSIQALLRAETPVVTVFGKSWGLHVSEALRLSRDENLEIIADTVGYLAARVPFVIYDAEHFFDGYADDPEYALATLRAAAAGGPARVVLCDTNGGSLPGAVAVATWEVVSNLQVALGVHCHNDGELAVANTLAAVAAGATHVQGTVNGYGERCGNANLCSLIPNLELKLGRATNVGRARLSRLRETAHFVSEIANLALAPSAPFVGDSAFAHKGGVHVSAVEREPRTYEHVPPESVGNRRRVLVSDLAGRSNLHAKARELGLDLPEEQRVLEELKRLEHGGYEFEAAEASFELLVRRLDGTHQPFFELLGFRVIDEHRGSEMPLSEATVRVRVGGHVEHTAASGTGPVNALDQALRRALEKFYPALAEVRLVDYKVRVRRGSLSGTASLVRVLITSGDGRSEWGTVGVSSNIVEASWRALVDAVEYKLLKDGAEPPTTETSMFQERITEGEFDTETQRISDLKFQI